MVWRAPAVEPNRSRVCMPASSASISGIVRCGEARNCSAVMTVTDADAAVQFRFVGLSALQPLPTRWLDPATRAQVVGAATVLLGAQQVLAGQLTPGELLIFLAYVGSLFKPVRDLGKLSAKFSRAAVSAQRDNQTLETAPESDDAPDANDIGRPAGEIVFEKAQAAAPAAA